MVSYIVIHRVECSGVQKYHQHHEPSADYFDVPRLSAQMNRTIGLHGRERIRDIEEYLEDHNDLSFAVYVTYSCTRYHDAIKDRFERLSMPEMDPTTAAQAKPYFYVLRQDGDLATPESEALILSERLEQALRILHDHNSEFLPMVGAWNTSPYFAYPYLQLYHQKDHLVDTTSRGLTLHYQSHLEALHDYVAQRLGTEHAEAEALFAKGLVNEKHWDKLYRPGAVVVTFENEQPLAYVSKMSPDISNNALQLQCWSWAFDGKFFRKSRVFNIPWPSDTIVKAITDLQVYPLDRATYQLRDELRSRGETFWACRSRKFLNYDVPLQGMEVQIVMFLRSNNQQRVC